MRQLGYRLPFAVMLVLGVFFVIQHYIPHPVVQGPVSTIKQWKQPVNAFIIFTGIFGLAAVHGRRVMKRERRWGYSAITLLSMAAMTFVGLVFGIADGGVFQAWFTHLITPIEATVFSLLAFYIASAAFRAFRARSAHATVLLASAVIVMLGLIPFVEQAFPLLASTSSFLLEYPNTAAKRAIVIGVALGAISVAIQTILGLDRTILGKERG
jgi:hypothetical protein